MIAHAGAASGAFDSSTRFDERLQVARIQSLEINLGGGRNHDHARARRYLATFQHLGSRGQIFQAPVGAGSQKGLINMDALYFGKRLDVVDRVGAGDHRFKLGSAVTQLLGVRCIGIRVDRLVGTPRPAIEIIEDKFIRRNIRILGACLGHQVGQRRPLIQRQGLNRIPVPFHGHV